MVNVERASFRMRKIKMFPQKNGKLKMKEILTNRKKKREEEKHISKGDALVTGKDCIVQLT